MADRAVVYEGTRLGPETIPGTPVPADTVLYATGFTPAYASDNQTFRKAGSKYNTLAYVTREWSTAGVEGKASYTDLVYLFRGLLGTPRIVDVAPGVYDWIWDVFDSRRDVPQTFTIERGSDLGAERMSGAFLTGLTLDCSRTDVTISGEALGRKFTPVTALTGNDIKDITVTGATGGTFTLTYAGQTTAGIAYNASAAAVQAALEALSNIDPGDVMATGGPLGTAPVRVTFQGALANTAITLTVDDTSLTGGDAAVTTVQSGTAITDVDPVLVYPQDLDIFLVTDPTDLDAADADDKLRRAFSLQIALTGKYGPVWAIDSDLDSFAAPVELAPDFGGTIVLGKSSDDTIDGLAGSDWFYARLGDSQIGYLKLAATGEEIGNTGYDHELDYSIAVRPQGPSDEDVDGVASFSYPLVNVASPAWNGRVAQVRLRVGFNTL